MPGIKDGPRNLKQMGAGRGAGGAGGGGGIRVVNNRVVRSTSKATPKPSKPVAKPSPPKKTASAKPSTPTKAPTKAPAKTPSTPAKAQQPGRMSAAARGARAKVRNMDSTSKSGFKMLGATTLAGAAPAGMGAAALMKKQKSESGPPPKPWINGMTANFKGASWRFSDGEWVFVKKIK
jgi:hypothetical protein